MCKRCLKKERTSSRKGFTLIELLVVIAIMGILSTMGVLSLRSSVINSRVKDATTSTASFLNKTANEASRLSKTLCVKKVSDKKLSVYKSLNTECSNGNIETTELDSLVLDNSLVHYGCEQPGEVEGNSWTGGAYIVFTPKLGLSALPTSGYVCIQYAGSQAGGLVQKSGSINSLKTFWRPDGRTTWEKL